MSATEKTSPTNLRLRFLARVVAKEAQHLQATDTRLFSTPLTIATIRDLDNNVALGERIEAFVGRFGRLQDTLGDKLLPALLVLVGERSASLIDNLDRAERMGWLSATDRWLETRSLRNQMVHEYIEDPAILTDALNSGHERVADLIDTAQRMRSEIDKRVA